MDRIDSLTALKLYEKPLGELSLWADEIKEKKAWQ